MTHFKALTALALAGAMSVSASVCAVADTTAASSAAAAAQNTESAPGIVSGLRWEGSKVLWNASSNSLQYGVEIYHNDALFISTTTSQTEYFMGAASYPSGTYTARVRGIGVQAVTGEWCSFTTPRYMGALNKPVAGSSTAKNAAATRYVQAGMGTPGWNHDVNGYWYCNPNMTYPANSWQEIDSKLYYFDTNGYIHNGWLQLNEFWYYITDNGALTGYNTIDNALYYFDDTTGALFVNTYTPDGRYADINGIVK